MKSMKLCGSRTKTNQDNKGSLHTVKEKLIKEHTQETTINAVRVLRTDGGALVAIHYVS